MNALKGVRDVLAPREMELGPGGEPQATATHWRLARDGDGIAWLIFDRADETANTLSQEVIDELDDMLAAVEADRPKALVIRSAKPNGFAAGADIRDFRGIEDSVIVEERLRRAHDVIDRLDRLSMPTMAVVHGNCLGGGLELALACDHRIAVSGARFGFPEVMLGLHPGLGGTFRLPRLIDPIEAMTMMLTGKTVHAAKAKRLGLADALVEERHVRDAVRAFSSRRSASKGQGWRATALGFAPARKLAARQMRAQTQARVREAHYPAPFRLIDLWEEHGGEGRAAQDAEIRSFAQLLTGPVAQNLVRVFFLREELRAKGKGDSGIGHVHVIGAGTMGGDIAAWCAARGLTVTLGDLDGTALAKAVGRAARFYDNKLHADIDRRDALDRLIPDFDGSGIARADLIIEAVAEKAEIKKKVFADVLARAKPDALIATNTSSIPLEELTDVFDEPGRLVGLHFFNPVTKMELVEVVAHDGADAAALDRARAFCGRISRLPAPVRSSPGFLVNRALTPYLAEAFVMLDEGVAKETIDRAAKDFGMPMGPIELADRVGLDIARSVARMLKEKGQDPLPEIPRWLDEKVERGELGVKTGKGLYTYSQDGKPKPAKDAPAPDEDMADRLILPMLNVCVRCLREGIVADAETLDGAMIFGTGFAPFRGGPINYARQRGPEEIVARLEAFEARHGARFAPDAGWSQLAVGEA